MPESWISRTITEIKALTANQITDYCRIFCVDWLEWVFYHPGYSVASIGNSQIRHVNNYDDFMFLSNDTTLTGAWLKDTNNLLIKVTDDEWAYKPPTFRPYKANQNVNLCVLNPVVKTLQGDTVHTLQNAAMVSWMAKLLPTNDTFNSQDCWIMTHPTTIISNDNPRTINAWGGGGVLWYQSTDVPYSSNQWVDRKKLFINEATVNESETNGSTSWNEISFAYSNRY